MYKILITQMDKNGIKIKLSYKIKIEVEKMQFTEGELYWQKKSKIANTYPYLTKDTSCDVLVIGGGITGAITAYFLAKEGANVIVAEKNILGFGSTSADTALLEYQFENDMHKLEKNIGIKATNRVYNLSLGAIEKIEKIDKEINGSTGFKRQDAIYYTNKFINKSSMAKEYNSRKKAGFNSYFIDSHSVINLNSGILTKNASGILNPYLFTQNLFATLDELDNVKIYENTRIDNIKCVIDGVKCVTNNNFKISADSVILASGFEALKYLIKAPIELVRSFTIVSKPVKELKNFDTSFTARDSGQPSHLLRFDNNGRIIFTGEEVKLTDKLMNKRVLKSVANDKYKRLYNALDKTLYNIPNIEIEYAFNNTVANTKDSLPIIDEIPGMPNTFCNLGFGSNGILHNVIGGNMLKDAVKGFYTKDMNMFKIDR